jgi:hypothetical protein
VRRAAAVLRRLGLLLGVQRLFQDLARLEREHAALADLDRIARLGISTWTLTLVAQHEVAEPADLDLFPAPQGLFHHLEDEIDDVRRLLLGEASDPRIKRLDDLGLRHDRLSPRASCCPRCLRFHALSESPKLLVAPANARRYRIVNGL